MDLQAAERILAQLEKESARVASIGKVRDELAQARQELGVGLAKVEKLIDGLQTAGIELTSIGALLRRGLDSMHEQLRGQIREISQTVENQLERTMGSVETLIRAESKKEAERTEHLFRELRTSQEQELAGLAAHQRVVSTAVSRNAWIQVITTALAAGVMLAALWLKAP